MTELLTIDQVATAVQVHPRTVRRAITRGELRAIDITGHGTWRIRPDDYDAWLEARATAPRDRTASQPDVVPIIAAAASRARAPRRQRGAGVLSVTADMGRTA